MTIFIPMWVVYMAAGFAALGVLTLVVCGLLFLYIVSGFRV